MHAKKILLSMVVLTATAAILAGKARHDANSGTAMIAAANKFLASVDEKQRAQATFGFDDLERLNWHFIPRKRKGLPLRDLEGEARQAGYDFIASGLSAAGYDQAVKVMSLEEVLFLLEGGDRQRRRERRHTQKYYLSVFGKPSNSGTWGWRVEGHHLSLNYTVRDGKVVSTTPEFFGSNPATIDAGVGRRLRVLGTEEDLARSLLKSLSAAQQKVVWIEKKAPRDLRGANNPQPDTTDPVGLPVSEMNRDQKQLMAQLLTEYLRNMPAGIEQERRARLEEAGLNQVYFAWWGGSELNEPHYYRVQGPTFLIEYNNTQNNANHVHSYWRNLAGDFNIPLTAAQ